MRRKLCGRCRESKTLEEFHNRTRSPDGKQDVCKECVKTWRKSYRTWDASNPEHVRKHRREWYHRNPDIELANRIRFAEHSRTVSADLGILTQKDSAFVRRPWEDWELQMLQCNEGLSDTDMAKALGTRSPKAVSVKRSKLRNNPTRTSRDP